jgi:hypothetical protein
MFVVMMNTQAEEEKGWHLFIRRERVSSDKEGKVFQSEGSDGDPVDSGTK